MPDPENEAEDAIPFQEELHLARAVESLRAAAPGSARDRRGHANDELLAANSMVIVSMCAIDVVGENPAVPPSLSAGRNLEGRIRPSMTRSD